MMNKKAKTEKKQCTAWVRDTSGGRGPAAWKQCEKTAVVSQKFCAVHTMQAEAHSSPKVVEEN